MIFSSQLGKLDGQTNEQALKAVANHLRKLQEELEYRLANLDSSNINEIDGSQTDILIEGQDIGVVIDGLGGKYSDLAITVDGFRTEVGKYGLAVEGYEEELAKLTEEVAGYNKTVAKYDAQVSTFNQTVDGFTATVQGYDQDVVGYAEELAKLTAQVAGYDETVKQYDTQVTTFNQTVSGFTTTVQGYDAAVLAYADELADLEIQVAGYEQAVKDYDAQVSTFNQTVSGFNTSVQGYDASVLKYADELAALNEQVAGYDQSVKDYDAQVSTFEQTVDGFNTTVIGYKETVDGYTAEYSAFNQTASSIEFRIGTLEDNQEASLTLDANGMIVRANGTSTTINGGNIDAETVTASALWGDVVTVMGWARDVYGNLLYDDYGSCYKVPYAHMYAGINSDDSTAFELFGTTGLRLMSNGNVYARSGNGQQLILYDGYCSLKGGAFVIDDNSFGSSLPSTGIYGQVYFLLE